MLMPLWQAPCPSGFLRLDVLSQPNGLTSAGYEACILGARRAQYCWPHADIPRHFNKFLEGAQGELDIVTEDIYKFVVSLLVSY